MLRKEDNITVVRLLFYCVKYLILTPEEAEHCLKTGRLPDNILERLRIAEQIGKN
jgi:hypothetical protein